MTKELAKISVISVLKVAPYISLLVAIIVGFFEYYMKKSGDKLIDSNSKAKILAYCIFVVLYVFKTMIPIICVVFLYNFISSNFGGIQFIVK